MGKKEINKILFFVKFDNYEIMISSKSYALVLISGLWCTS